MLPSSFSIGSTKPNIGEANIVPKVAVIPMLVNSSSSLLNILSLSEKYNLPISEEILEFENVVSNTPDEIDTQLEVHLKNLYKIKNLPKINFKKVGNNSYEYGTIKVNIIFDNNIIKVKTPSGIINLDKFIEKNAETEDAKIKNNYRVKNLKKKK